MVAQERHSELSFGRVLGTNEEAQAEGADRKRPRGGAVAAPSAYEPRDCSGYEPDATNPHYIVPHRRIYDSALLRPVETPASTHICDFAGLRLYTS
jgi:hypothetical protein